MDIYTKVSTESTLESLSTGDSIFKYPLTKRGPLDDFDETDISNYWEYIIVRNWSEITPKEIEFKPHVPENENLIVSSKRMTYKQIIESESIGLQVRCNY